MSDKVAELTVRFPVVEKSLGDEFLTDFPSYVQGLVRGDPGGLILSKKYADNAEKYFNFPLRSEDVWVITYPKCGTTWTQEMVWMIAHDCDTEAAKESLITRSPFIELPDIAQIEVKPEEEDVLKSVTLDKIGEMPSPRVIKTHLPFYLLPPHLVDTCKVVYVARNPKDVIVSYFHHHKLFTNQQFTADIEKFADYFMKDELYYSPFFAHIFEGWAKRDHPNVLFLFYEDRKRNLGQEIDKVCAFLGKTLSEEQLQVLLKHLHFDNFSKNEFVNFEFLKDEGLAKEEGHFIRKGKTGDWKNHFSPELNSRLDEWIKKNLEGTDLKFTMELDHQD